MVFLFISCAVYYTHEHTHIRTRSHKKNTHGMEGETRQRFKTKNIRFK